MESLYRKYRPLTFESVVGQQHIVSTLEHAVAEGRLSHAYLFCGPRGTGKTTMARILAKSLLCEGAEAARAAGASGCNPDGTCPECAAIAEGTHPDVYELDAASRTGVDNVREEIINSVGFAPVRGAYKVYIIDEVHMLTTQAFNALLKTLEEPPAHVIFVLCTTDPQKILETILSRCQRFDFHRISNDDIIGRLRYICEQEGFAFDAEALEIVARHARGGMRDALSTLEQLSVFGDGSVRADDARALLGEVASTVLAKFASAIAQRDVVGLFGLVRAQADEGNDILELTRDLVAHMRDVYTASIAGPRAELFDGTPEEVAALVKEASLFEGPDRLARTLTVLDDAALEMRNASDPRLVLEIACTRLSRPEADLTLEALAERLARLESQIAAGIPSAPMDAERLSAVTGVPTHGQAAHRAAASAAPPAPRAAAASVHHAPVQGTAPAARASVPVEPLAPSTSAPAPAVGADPAAGVESVPSAGAAPAPAAASPVSTSAHPAAPQQRAAASAAAAPSSVAAPAAPVAPTAPAVAPSAPTPADSELQRRWAEAVKRVVAAQPSRGGLLQSSRAVSDDGEALVVAFPKGSTFALKMITRPDSHALVTPIICEVFGPRTVSYVMDGGPGGAPAPKAAPSTAKDPAAAAPAPTAPAPARPSASGPASASAPGSTAPVSASASVPRASEPSAPAPVSACPQTSAADRPSAPAPAVDQASGPSVLPERDIDADRKAWEDEQVPYDDAMIASYSDDDELPPFDVPAQPAAQVSPAQPANHAAQAPSAVSQPDAPASASPAPRAPKDAAAPAPGAAPSQSVPAASPAAASGDAVDAKEVLQNIWGNVVFK